MIDHHYLDIHATLLANNTRKTPSAPQEQVNEVGCDLGRSHPQISQSVGVRRLSSDLPFFLKMSSILHYSLCSVLLFTENSACIPSFRSVLPADNLLLLKNFISTVRIDRFFIVIVQFSLPQIRTRTFIALYLVSLLYLALFVSFNTSSHLLIFYLIFFIIIFVTFMII